MLYKSIFVMTTVLCVQASAMRPGSEDCPDDKHSQTATATATAATTSTTSTTNPTTTNTPTSTTTPDKRPFMIEMPDGSYLVGKAAIAYDMFLNGEIPGNLMIIEHGGVTISDAVPKKSPLYPPHPLFDFERRQEKALEEAAFRLAMDAEKHERNASITPATSADTSTASTSTTNSKDSNISAASVSAAGGRDSVEGGNISASMKGKSDPFAFYSDEFE